MTYQEIYQQAIANGCSPVMADMLASRCPPGTLNTDRAFLEGWGHQDQFEGDTSGYGDFVRQQAAKAGVETTGRRYLSTLARFPGDPRAWVADRSDVKRICEEDGLGCPEAGTRVASCDAPGLDDKPYEVAEDIVVEKLANECAVDPDLNASKKRKVERYHTLKKKMSGNTK